jgi:hypothetical protein
MPGLAGIVFILVFGVIVVVWSVWVFGREEQQKEAARKKELDEHKPPLADT